MNPCAPARTRTSRSGGTRSNATPWRTSPKDRLTLIVLGVFATLLGIHRAPILPLLLIATLAGAIVLLAFLTSRSKVARVAHQYSPIAWVPCVFSLVGPVITATNSSRWDGVFRAIDARWFAGLADAWRDALGRPAWLTDLASIAYGSFYFLPIVMAIAVHRHRPEFFEPFAFAVQLAFYIPYAGYLLFPTFGPRVAAGHEAEILGGGAISAGLRASLQATELNMLDAFPSGHAAVSLVVFSYGGRLFPRWRLPLALLVAGIVFATVYLSLHYVIDLVAGGAVALLVPLLVPVVGRACGLRAPSPEPAAVVLSKSSAEARQTGAPERDAHPRPW